MSDPLSSVEQTAAALGAAGYLAGESTALVAFLAARLGKPVLVEGPAGVGKTELAKALARATHRPLVRLQCYEGLDEAKALYEWNYRKQLLRIQTERADAGWDAVQDDIFSEEFLLSRPLLQAIEHADPVVLLVDEIDKTDQEFEAMLLELLSDFQISIPELGPIRARSRPLVLLTSNNTRELTEALKRRCLYLWLDYPEPERELEIVRLHAPELAETVARRLVDVMTMVRELDLKKPPSIAESIDWARALLLLGAEEIDAAMLRRTLSVIVKHRTDLDVVAARLGLEAPDGVLPAPAPDPSAAAGGFAARLLGFCDELRAEGLALGTAEILDAVHALEAVPWTREVDVREALAATLAKSPEDRRVFDLVWERFLFRAVEAQGSPRRRRATARRPAAREAWTAPSCERASPRPSRRATTPPCATSRGSPSAPSARPAGLGRARGRGPPAPAPRARPRPPACGRSAPAARAARHAARAARALRAPPAARVGQRAGAAHGRAAARPAAARARPRPAHRPRGGPRRGAPRGGPAQAPPRHAGPGAARPRRARDRWTCAARCAPRSRRGACRCTCAIARAALGGPSSTWSATSPRA